jgi:hypothetical protein
MFHLLYYPGFSQTNIGLDKQSVNGTLGYTGTNQKLRARGLIYLKSIMFVTQTLETFYCLPKAELQFLNDVANNIDPIKTLFMLTQITTLPYLREQTFFYSRRS